MRCKHCQRVIVNKYPLNPDGHVKWAVVRRVPLKLYDKHPERIYPEWSSLSVYILSGLVRMMRGCGGTIVPSFIQTLLRIGPTSTDVMCLSQKSLRT